MNRIILTISMCVFCHISLAGNFVKNILTKNEREQPRIVNIVNFIRLLEPRDARITEDVLYKTVVKQVEMMKKYNLRGTFLLQYDALLDLRYQKLFKSLPVNSFEIGGWWEIPQPLVERAGLKWRGRYPWDWRVNIGFSIGYSLKEREKLVDVYMRDFKRVFGYYPKSMGSWFIDAHTLQYMYRKYKVMVSCNCKDQIGTDGYTMWGGYWNQAYYPSIKNAYMPAQHRAKQVPVPVFRMLGSDPIHQYDSDPGNNKQRVVTLEPACMDGGGDSIWVNWYFKPFMEGEAMEYAYVQVGQENSFTWSVIKKGFELQIPLIAQLRDENKVKVETLAESGQWFRTKYKVTPSTSVTVNEDMKGSDCKTVWFDSRFYRANLLWSDGTLCFRDIHLFNENLLSDFVTKKAISNECSFFTLPFVDGHQWSSDRENAGLWFKMVSAGKEIAIEGENPEITSPVRGRLDITWPLKLINGKMKMNLTEKQMVIKYEGDNSMKWFLDLTVANKIELPFMKVSKHRIYCCFKGMTYSVTAKKGSFAKSTNKTAFRMNPEKNVLILNMS